MKQFLRKNGLSVAVFGLFVLFLGGQAVSGHRHYNDELREHGLPRLSAGQYLASGHFFEATFENWESEFFQMALYILLTAFLFQKGSSESNPLPEEGGEPEPRTRGRKPWPVRKGGLVRKVYEHSLSLALGLLFLGSFVGHAFAGRSTHNREQLAHGKEAVGLLEYVSSSRFWFESFQNWQSEFLSIGAIVVLSIFLREKDSSQSKDVESPHGRTAA